MTSDLPEQNINYKTLGLGIFGASIGTFFEFYCFGLVGYFEKELAIAYFPSSSASLLKSFTLFGIAFVFRPFGGLLFGHIGDKYGRVYSFRISLACMSVSSFLFAFIPNYSTIGYWATALAFILRAVQGFCVGGEMSTALVYIMEESPKHIRGTLIGVLWCFSSGTYLSLIVFVVWNDTSSSYSSSSWTWRIPFACSIFIGFFGLWLRRFMPISHEFQEIVDHNMIASNPIWSTIQDYPKETVILLCAYSFPPMGYYAIVIWIPSYLQSSAHQSSDEYSYDVMLVTGILMCMQYIIGGWMSDKYGNYFCVKYGMICFMPFLFANWTVISVTDNFVLITICQLSLSVFGIVNTSLVVWCVGFVKDVRIRNTITGITYNLGMVFLLSTLLDVLTALAGINVKIGGMIAATYMCIFGGLCLGAIVYGENRNSKMWIKKYQTIADDSVEENREENKEEDDQIKFVL